MAITSTPLKGSGEARVRAARHDLPPRAGASRQALRKLQVFADVFVADFGIESPATPEAGAGIASKNRNESIGPTRKTAPLLRQSDALSMKLLATLAALSLLF